VSGPGQGVPRGLRLFFALWPSDAHRASLTQAAATVVGQVAGRPVPPGNLHVTLAFLGRVAGRGVAGLVAIGGRGPWPAIRLEFGPVEYWAKPKVLVARPESIPMPVRDVVDRLWQGLEPLGFVRDPRPWRPHLTLMRKVTRPPPENLRLAPIPDEPMAPAWRLALVDSLAGPDGPRYKPLADWPLGGV
jgi:2'-5' RNA ligase